MKYLDVATTSLTSFNYRELNEESVEALMESILAVGVQEPIHIYETTDTNEKIILSGHHRVEAMRRLQASSPHLALRLPYRTSKGTKAELTKKENLVPRLLSNLMRTDLSIVERAAACAELKNTGESTASVAKIVGSSKRTIEKLLSVHDLPQEAKLYVKEKGLSDGKVYAAAAKWKREGKNISVEDLFISSKPQSSSANASITLTAEQLMKALKSAKVSERASKAVMELVGL